MCELSSATMKAEALRFFKQQDNNISFNIADFKRRFPFSFQPSRCPVCGVYLSDNDMRPPGKATRSMCVVDYESLIANDINNSCFICGGALPFEKVAKQLKNPREVTYHVEDGPCMSLWTVMHNIVLGATDVATALANSIEKTKLLDPFTATLPMYNRKPVRLIT